MVLNRKTEIFSLVAVAATFAIFAAFSSGIPVYCLAQSLITGDESFKGDKKLLTLSEIKEITGEKTGVTPENLIKSAVLVTPEINVTPERKFSDNFTVISLDKSVEITPERSTVAPKKRQFTAFGDLVEAKNTTSDVDVTLKETMPEGFGKIGLDLPLESRLEIVIRTNPPAGVAATGGSAAGGITSGFSLTQDLQVRLSGTVGKRVTVNVDYDDTKEQQRDISLIYKGEPDELIQQAQFGDVILTLPNTEFTGYSKSIFGGDVELKFKNLTLKAIGAQTKGKTKTVSFSGGYSQQKMDISDTSFVKQKYYKLQADDTHLPIVQGSEQIWIDDLNGYNNNYPPLYPSDRGTDVTKYTQKTLSGNFSLDCLHPGTDYTIDYTTGIVTFNRSIQSNYVVVVAYKYASGASNFGFDSNSIFDFDDSVYAANKRFLQPLLGDVTYYDRQLMNYYGLGNKKILNPQYDPEFIFKIYDQNNTEQPITNYGYSLDLDNGFSGKARCLPN